MGKILIVDDNEDNLFVTTLVLSKDQYDIITASGGQEALDKANSEAPDVILLDINLPDIDGFEVCKRLKAQETTWPIPVIFLTGKYKDDESLIQGLSIGAEDYILRPFSSPELCARVKVMVRLKQNLDALAEKNKQLEQLNKELEEKNTELNLTQKALEELAITDPLTQVYNRRYFTERLKEEFSFIKRETHPISLIMLDIDYFKRVNDTHGHQCGDDVLIQFASILQKNVRKHDTVARYGGEEFIIAMYGLGTEAALATAERIRQDVAEYLFHHEDTKLHLTTSLGVASYPEVCSDSPTPDRLLQQVDSALYYAKGKGRNQTICAPLSQKSKSK